MFARQWRVQVPQNITVSSVGIRYYRFVASISNNVTLPRIFIVHQIVLSIQILASNWKFKCPVTLFNRSRGIKSVTLYIYILVRGTLFIFIKMSLNVYTLVVLALFVSPDKREDPWKFCINLVLCRYKETITEGVRSNDKEPICRVKKWIHAKIFHPRRLYSRVFCFNFVTVKMFNQKLTL